VKAGRHRLQDRRRDLDVGDAGQLVVGRSGGGAGRAVRGVRDHAHPDAAVPPGEGGAPAQHGVGEVGRRGGHGAPPARVHRRHASARQHGGDDDRSDSGDEQPDPRQRLAQANLNVP
jgi:hypothetical protein